ncbi:hypothetical protein ACRAWG_09880 [Methylobacterium sp. P31]
MNTFDPNRPRTFDKLFRPGDHPRMTEAVRYLLRNNRTYIRRPSPTQLKVGDLNFWPKSGKIFRDGDLKSLPEQGLVAFARALGWPEPGSAEDGAWAREREARAAQRAASTTSDGADLAPAAPTTAGHSPL